MLNNVLIYFHGLGSSGNSSTVGLLRQQLPELEIIAPDIPTSPVQAIPYLRQLCIERQPALVMGTSMGAMYAQQMHGLPKLLVNPAFHVSATLEGMVGARVPFFSARADGARYYDVTPALVEEMKQIEASQWKGITPFDITHTMGLFGTRDDVVDCRDEYLAHYIAMHEIDCGHRIEPQALSNTIVPLLRELIEAPID